MTTDDHYAAEHDPVPAPTGPQPPGPGDEWRKSDPVPQPGEEET